MKIAKEVKEYYRDAYQQAQAQGMKLGFKEFVKQEREKIEQIITDCSNKKDGGTQIDWIGFIKKLRKEGSIDKFIPLTTLQKLVQHTGKESFNMNDIFDFPENRVIQDQNLKNTAVPRTDDLIESQSDSQYTFATEWISNAIDAVSPHKQIGRFGEGFFQSLQHLQDEGDEISVHSKKSSSDGYSVSLQKRGDQIYVAPKESETSEVGTSVTLKKKLSDSQQKKFRAYISSKFRANTRAIITLNGTQVNNFGDYQYINGQDRVDEQGLPQISITIDSSGISVSDEGVGMDANDLAGKLLYPNTTSKKREKISDEDVKKLSPDETRFFYTYKKENKNKTHISLQVAGVIIEDFHVTSVGNIGECIFEFPSFSPLEDSRNEIKVGRETTISLTSALEKIAEKSQTVEEKLGLLEVIGAIYHHLKDRPTNIVDEEFTLETNMKKTFKSIREDIESSGITILPATEKMMNAFGVREDIFYIDPDFMDFDVTNIPGIMETSESILGKGRTKTGKQVRFFEADFDADANHDYLLLEDAVIVNRRIFEGKTVEEKDKIIQALNVGINLNTGYELGEENVFYGRIPTSSEGEIVAKEPKKKQEKLSLASIQSITKETEGGGISEEVIQAQLEYFKQEFSTFKEKYGVKINIGKKVWSHSTHGDEVIGKILRQGLSIKDIIIFYKLSFLLDNKINKEYICSGASQELLIIFTHFLDSKNASLTIPTFRFLSQLASQLTDDPQTLLQYTKTLFRALEQDPKNVVILMQEFSQEKERWENDPIVGHLERTRITYTDTSAFKIFFDILEEKRRLIRQSEKTSETKSGKMSYILDIEQLRLIADDLFSHGTRRHTWALEILDQLPILSSEKLSRLRKYLLETNSHELSLSHIQGILGGELGKLETNIDIFSSLQSIFLQENTEKESQEYYFPVDWEQKIETICLGEDVSKMKRIIHCMIQYNSPTEIYGIYRYFTENDFTKGSMDQELFKKYFNDLGRDSGEDLLLGVNVAYFMDYFYTFFYKEENEPEYIPDIITLDLFIADVFPDPTKQSSENIIALSDLIKSLYSTSTGALYIFRKLLLERDDFTLREIFNIIPSFEVILPKDDNTKIVVLDMLKQVFQYELDEHKKLSKKSQKDNTETSSQGEYQFPDDIEDIINTVLPRDKEFERTILTRFVGSLKNNRTSHEIHEVRKLVLEGRDENFISFIRLIGTLDQVDGYNHNINFSSYIPSQEVRENGRKVFLAMKEVFEYEIDQKKWDEYFQYSYLNPDEGKLYPIKPDSTILEFLQNKRSHLGESTFIKHYVEILDMTCLLGYIHYATANREFGADLGISDEEEHKLEKEFINKYFEPIGIQYDQFLLYLQGEYGDTDNWYEMVSKRDYSRVLKQLGYTPAKAKNSEDINQERQDISDIKLPEEFFTSLSTKYPPEIVAFAQFLESDGEYLSPRESKIDITESGIITTSLSHIIAASLTENSTLGKGGIDLTDFAGLLGNTQAGQKHFQDIIAGVCLAQDEVSMYFLREGIQNARDALIAANKSEQAIQVEFYDKDGKFTTSMQDNVGMQLSDIIVKLLTPYSSGKNGIDSTGKFGKGFFTFAVGCSELRIKSSNGNGKVSYTKMTPKLVDGIIQDFEVYIEERKEEFTGTIIERSDELGGIHGNLRALIGTHLLKKYTGNTEEVDINFHDTTINSPEKKTLVAESEAVIDANGRNLGTLKIYKTRDNTERFTKDNLWISEIKEDILSDFPDWIIDFFRKQKYSLDIPSGTPLVGSRNSLENREQYIHLFKPHMYRMVIDIVLKEHVKNSMKIPMMPEDYLALLKYERTGSDDIRLLAAKYNAGENLTESEAESLKDSAHMAQFLTEVEFMHNGKKTSLREIKRKLHENITQAKDYGGRFEKQVVQAINQKDSLNQVPEKMNLSYKEVQEFTGLDTEKIQAFKTFIQERFSSIIEQRFGGKYTISFHTNPKGGEIANSYGSAGFGCSFRVDTPEFKRLVENINNPRIQEKIIDIVAHEMTHNEEHKLSIRKWGTHETDELHDASFMRINREIITQLLRSFA